MIRVAEMSLSDLQSMDVLCKVFTRRRAQILIMIASGRFSLAEIQGQLKVNRSFLTETIGLLQSLGIIQVEKVGRKKFPALSAQKIIVKLRE